MVSGAAGLPAARQRGYQRAGHERPDAGRVRPLPPPTSLETVGLGPHAQCGRKLFCGRQELPATPTPSPSSLRVVQDDASDGESISDCPPLQELLLTAADTHTHPGPAPVRQAGGAQPFPGVQQQDHGRRVVALTRAFPMRAPVRPQALWPVPVAASKMFLHALYSPLLNGLKGQRGAGEGHEGGGEQQGPSLHPPTGQVGAQSRQRPGRGQGSGPCRGRGAGGGGRGLGAGVGAGAQGSCQGRLVGFGVGV